MAHCSKRASNDSSIHRSARQWRGFYFLVSLKLMLLVSAVWPCLIVPAHLVPA
jgi:hypothetical protein